MKGIREIKTVMIALRLEDLAGLFHSLDLNGLSKILPEHLAILAKAAAVGIADAHPHAVAHADGGIIRIDGIAHIVGAKP